MGRGCADRWALAHAGIEDATLREIEAGGGLEKLFHVIRDSPAEPIGFVAAGTFVSNADIDGEGCGAVHLALRGGKSALFWSERWKDAMDLRTRLGIGKVRLIEEEIDDWKVGIWVRACEVRLEELVEEFLRGLLSVDGADGRFLERHEVS